MGRAHAPAEKKAIDTYTVTSDRAVPLDRIEVDGEMRKGSARGGEAR